MISPFHVAPLAVAMKYPPGPVMGLWSLVTLAFIFGGGWLFRAAALRDRRAREALAANPDDATAPRP